MSTFNADWLHERCFAEDIEPVKSITPNHVALWGSEQIENIPRMNFDDVLTDDSALFKWIDFLRVYGLVFITDSPKEPGQVKRLAKRVAGYLHPTVHG